MIEARQLTKVFRDTKRGEVRAVDGVSFRCQPGQVFGLLGVNGAGKTTCLRILGTILQPSSGTATVGGFDVVEQPEKSARQHWLSFDRHGALRAADRAGDSRVFRPPARPDGRVSCASASTAFSPLST